MPEYTPPIRRRNHGKGHSYVDARGHKVPGVTTVLGKGFPAPGLINWAANATIDAAVDYWDELAELPVSDRIKRLQRARHEDRDAAANQGTKVHRFGEDAARGLAVEPPDELVGHVQAYVAFLDEWDVQPIIVEGVIVSHRHGYAGTLDLIASLADPDDSARRVRWLLDIKTSRSGVFGNHVLQLAAYRYADAYLDGDGIEKPLPEVDRVGVVHVRADGYELIPVDVDPAVHRYFLYTQQVATFTEDWHELVGAALEPPAPAVLREGA